MEDRFDGFEVIVGIHVEYRVVLVIEAAVCICAGFVAFHEVLEVIVVALRVAVGVHGHKACVLQKARVDATTDAGEGRGHTVNHVIFKPLNGVRSGQCVDGRRAAARVNRPAHHDHGQRSHFATRCHKGNRRHHWDGGLAHAHDVAIAVLGLQVTNELLHIVDVVV